jgi:Fe-S cluster assembly scaffold protein SufB
MASTIVKHETRWGAALTAEEVKWLRTVGYATERSRAATCVLADQQVRHIAAHDNQVEILPIAEALKRYDWVQDLMFGLIDPEENEHVRQVAERTEEPVGRFVRVMEGAKVRLPVQLFTLIETPQQRQFIHNLGVIEKGAEVEMVSGCGSLEEARAGHHVSVSETYLREGASCRSVSIEQWGPGTQVRSYGRTHVGRGAHTIDSNIMLAPVRYHYSQSKTDIDENGTANDQTIVFAPPGTQRTFENETHLKETGARCESLMRMVTAGGDITNRNMLVGDAAETKGYLGCDGLKLADAGDILSVPGLMAKNAKAQLSHEASIGMISREKMAYLMATGMTEERARDLIIQGFLNLKEEQIPEAMREEIKAMIAAAQSGSM